MLAFTTDELAKRFRSDVDDKITDAAGSDADCLWSNYDVYGYMTAACDALSRESAGVYRTIQLPITAYDPNVRLPSYVLHVREAWLTSPQRVELRQLNANDTDASRYRDEGAPRFYIRDLERRSLRLVPAPPAPDTLELMCTVSIRVPLGEGLPLPFLETVDQLLLLHYMKSLAYRKHDAETEDLVRARDHEQHWLAGVQDRKSELNNYRRKPTVIRMSD